MTVHKRTHGTALVALDDESGTVSVVIGGDRKEQQFQVRVLSHELFDSMNTEEKARGWEPYTVDRVD